MDTSALPACYVMFGHDGDILLHLNLFLDPCGIISNILVFKYGEEMMQRLHLFFGISSGRVTFRYFKDGEEIESIHTWDSRWQFQIETAAK